MMALNVWRGYGDRSCVNVFRCAHAQTVEETSLATVASTGAIIKGKGIATYIVSLETGLMDTKSAAWTSALVMNTSQTTRQHYIEVELGWFFGTSCSLLLAICLAFIFCSSKRPPALIFTLYRIVLQYSVVEVELSANGGVQREILLGGYRILRKLWMFHLYCLAMIYIVANWFLIMFFDTFLYRKSSTCNDLDVRDDAYLCFNVERSIKTPPIDCTDPRVRDNDDIYVIFVTLNILIFLLLYLLHSVLH